MLLDAPDTITLVVNFLWETLSTDHYVNPISTLSLRPLRRSPHSLD